jgi:RNA polymerase primary sigma factor
MKDEASLAFSISATLLDQYLKEISNYPLLSREEEILLSERIKKGDQRAANTLITSNLRFVVSIAKKYRHLGLPLSDLISEGNLGLIKAVKRFDQTKDARFISYAVWWIKQGIFKALADQSQIVRVPIKRAWSFSKIHEKLGALTQELGREPNDDEVAKAMGIDPELVREAVITFQPHLSLNSPLTSDEDSSFIDFISDEAEHLPDRIVNENMTRESISGCLSKLNDREARVIKLYFGLEGQEPMTLREIGKIMGISRERVRQIKETAINRLRRMYKVRVSE